MSVQAMTWVFEHSKSTLGSRLVLLAIAGHADREGSNSWASVQSLAEEARLSERQTQYALRKLEELGEIAKIGRRGKRADRQRVVYELPKMRPAESAPRGSGPRGAILGTSGPRGAVSGTDGVHPIAPEPRTSSSSKPLERERDPAFDALARAGGKNPKALTRTEARTVGVKLAEIVDAERARLGDTPSRQHLAGTIHEAGERYGRLHPTWERTPAAIAAHWSELVASPPEPVQPGAVSGTSRDPVGVEADEPLVSVEESERAGAEAIRAWKKRRSDRKGPPATGQEESSG